MDIGLSRRDLYRFTMAYRGASLRETLARDGDFWRAVKARAERLYRSEWGRPAPSL
jgi:heptose I phosphotransferase